eukprot:161036-Pelagomonas_calceolata.AAC.4
MQVVRATPLPHHMLHCLLQSGLLRLSTAKLRELSLALLGKKGKAEVLKASYRRNHTAKAAQDGQGWGAQSHRIEEPKPAKRDHEHQGKLLLLAS